VSPTSAPSAIPAIAARSKELSRLDALEAIAVQLVRKGKLVESYDHDRKECQVALSCLIPSATHLPSCAASMPTAVT
jgi:hypothetical protein